MPDISMRRMAERARDLLVDVRNRSVRRALRRHRVQTAPAGSWPVSRLLIASRVHARGRVSQGHAVLAQLGAWEARWLPLAAGALRARHDDVYEWLFRSGEHGGASVVISVRAFVSRLEDMAAEPALGARGAQARELLRQLGLSAASVQIARDLLEALGAAPPATCHTSARGRARARRGACIRPREVADR